MVNYSANTLKDEYPFILPHVFDRVRQRNVYIIDLYDRTKMVAVRLFDAVYLVRYIIERKVGQSLALFKNVEDILARSLHFEEVARTADLELSTEQVQPQHDNELVNNIIGGIVKVVAEAPGKNFVKLKEERPQLTLEQVAQMMASNFGIPRDYILIKEIFSNEMMLSNLSIEEIRSLVRREVEQFRQQGLAAAMSQLCYLHHVCDRLFASMFHLALNNLVQRLLRLFRDIEQLLKELGSQLGEKVVTQSQQKIFDRLRNWKTKPDAAMAEKYPKAKHFDFDAQLPLMDDFIKPFQRAMDKLFAKDKLSRNQGAQDSHPKLAAADEESQTLEGPPKKMDVDLVKKMVLFEKNRHHLPINQSAVRSAKSESKREPASTAEESRSACGKKSEASKELRQILGFGSTISSLQNCFEMRSRKLRLMDLALPSIAHSQLPSKVNSAKVRRILSKIRSPAYERSQHRPPEGSASVESGVPEGLSAPASASLQRPGWQQAQRRAHVRSADHSSVDKSPVQRVTRSRVAAALKSPEVDPEASKRTNSKSQGQNRSFQITSSAPRRDIKSGLNLRQEASTHWREPKRLSYRERLQESGTSKEEDERLEKHLDSFILSPFLREQL